jgi:ATP-dependent exoDNAse (exonuclease V) beta subunit
MESSTTFSVYNASAGSGKTFTLVKEYLKILLTSESDYAFQNILAITFTNKAAAEMKERILDNLRSFSVEEQNDMFVVLSQEIKVDSAKIHSRSKRVLEKILQNYSAFNITTIDSFTHKLIRTFAYDLGLPLNFEVEMDGGKLISEAIDVLISKIGNEKALTDVLIAFSLQKVEDDKAWDISKELNTIAKILLNEEDQEYLKVLQLKSLEDFKEIENRLKLKKGEIENLFNKNGQEGLSYINNSGLENKSFFRSYLPNHFKKLTSISQIDPKNLNYEGQLQNNIENDIWYSKTVKKDIQTTIDSMSLDLLRVYEEGRILFEKHYGDYVLIDMVLKTIIPLAVLNHIQKELNTIKEQNTICLSSEFNQLISAKIKNEPAPFIYERIGEKFHHYFIDEMQDTSSLQWQNLIPLINNALSQEKGSLLLVGDAKQAIYRWRGGKAEQFIDLSIDQNEIKNNPFYIDKNTENLAVNYRSFSEIINFNNAFFTHIASFLSNSVYRELYEIGNQQQLNKNSGGFVQLDFLDKSELSKEEKELTYPIKVLEIINNLDPNFKKKDICVLVRTKKDGVAVANYLSENGIDIVSSETLLLQNSLKVQFLIEVLTYIQNPLNKNAKFNIITFLKRFLKIEKSSHLFYEELIDLEPISFFQGLEKYGIIFNFELFLQMPFYESVEQLIRSFKLLSSTDAYVQFFLDFVLDFQRKNYNDLSAFLVFWEQKKEKLSIASVESETAVRIMTIHKSKGLEFPVVVFPCDVDVVNEIEPTVWVDNLEERIFGTLGNSLISCSNKITFTGEKGTALFEKRKEELALDNFNLLYVALTRSVEQLYVITEYKIDKTGNEKTTLFSGMFINFLKTLSNENSWCETKHCYEFGEKRRILPIKEEKDVVKTEIQEIFISTPWDSHDIKIVANSSKNWGTVQESSVKYGLMIHEMLSKIIIEDDVDKVLNFYVASGVVSLKEYPELKKILESIVSHKLLNAYFKKSYTIFTEREIVDEFKRTLIPDRLMFKGNEVIIIDYKTGTRLAIHKEQIDGYATILTKMDYIVVKKIIIYIDSHLLIEVF